MTVRAPRVLVATVVLLGASVASARAATAWFPSEAVPGTNGIASALVPLTLPDGTMLVVLATRDGVREVASRSRRTGQWNVTTVIDPNSRIERVRPAVAIGPNGVVLAAWRLSDGQVRVSARSPRPARWSRPQVLASGADGVPTLAVGSGGDAVVTWTAADAVVVRTRSANAPDWAPPTVLSDPTRSARIAVSGAAVNRSGAVAVAWSSERAGDGVASVAVRASRESAWPTATELPGGRPGAVGAPVLAVDAAGTFTAAWVSGSRVIGAVRTAASRTWIADADPAVADAVPVLEPLAIASEAAGRTVVATRTSTGRARSVAVRDGAAAPWESVVVRPAASGDRFGPQLAVAVRGGDVVVASGHRIGATCDVSIVASPVGETAAPEERMAGICTALAASSNSTGDILLVGAGLAATAPLRAIVRPSGGLRFVSASLERVVVSATATPVLRARVSWPARVTVRVVNAAGRAVARRAVALAADSSRIALRPPTGKFAAGRYTVIAGAANGALVAPERRFSLRITPAR